MGVNDRANDKKEEKRARAKEARGRRAAASGSYTWEQFDWYGFIALTEGICAQGGALRVGFTRDGGAIAIGVYLGDDYATEYIRPAEDFPTACEEIADAWLGKEKHQFRTRYNELSGR